MWIAVPATAEVVRHLIAVPFAALGLAFLRWADPIARFYAGAFKRTGLTGFADAYAAGAVKRFVVLAGLVFLGAGIYWAIAGTG